MNTQKGFTLVELAIALMVIGLLIGGVLKGQELIENARVTRVVKDLTDYNAAIMVFRNAYEGMPGDIRKPTRLPNCNTAPCNNEWNVGTLQISSRVKSRNFWIHMERAGLISGIDETTTDYLQTSPLHVYDGHFVAMYTATGNGGAMSDPRTNSILMTDPKWDANLFFSPGLAAAIDTKMDNGKPLTGSVIMAHNIAFDVMSAQAPPSACINTTTEEYLNTRDAPCMLLIRLGSMQ